MAVCRGVRTILAWALRGVRQVLTALFYSTSFRISVDQEDNILFKSLELFFSFFWEGGGIGGIRNMLYKLYFCFYAHEYHLEKNCFLYVALITIPHYLHCPHCPPVKSRQHPQVQKRKRYNVPLKNSFWTLTGRHARSMEGRFRQNCPRYKKRLKRMEIFQSSLLLQTW